jgi:GTP-binding protein EngB required for normal cell division
LFFTDAEVAGGFPSRFLWFSTQDRTLKRSVEPIELGPFRAAFVDWKGVQSIRALPKMDEAHKDQHFDSMEGKVEPIDSHLLLTRAKVACALAVLDNRAELNQEDWELSEIVIEHSRQTRSVILETLSKEGAKARDKTAKAAAVVAATTEQMKHEQNVKRVASNIKKAFKAGKVKVLTEKGLAKHISSRDRDSLLEAIQFLEDNPRWGED